MQVATSVGRQLDVDAEGLEDVGGSGAAGRGAVAVLGDLAARPGGDQRGGGRDVEGGRAAASAGRVEQAGLVDLDVRGELPHRPRQTDQLGDRLALGAQRDQEGGGLHLARPALHDLRERRGGVVGGQVGSGADLVDRAGEDVVGHRRIH